MSCGVAVKFVGCAMVCDVWCAVMSAEITLTGAKPSTKRLRQCSGSWATEIQHIFSVFDTFVFSLASTGHGTLSKSDKLLRSQNEKSSGGSDAMCVTTFRGSRASQRLFAPNTIDNHEATFKKE